jgi:acyl carrier protein
MNKNALDVMKELLKERLDIAEERVTADSILLDLGIDSLMQIELLFDFEDKYKVKIPDTSIKPITIGELLSIVEPFMPKDL